MADWHDSACSGTTASLHARNAVAHERTITWCRPTDAALVLGSTQDEAIVDREALAKAKLAVVRRRSGGGAVLVRPGASLWVDAFLPRNDALFHVDVGVAFEWFGQAWASALADIGVHNVQVHRGAYRAKLWGRRVCFAGMGPGEVCAGDRKLVGISARRTREGAWFQSALLIDAETALLARLVHAEIAQIAASVGDLRSLGIDVPAADIVKLLISHLPA